MTTDRCQKRHAEKQAAHGKWCRIIPDGISVCWGLPVGSCVGATRFPKYRKWLQRERRMVLEGVRARIHRQPCVAAGLLRICEVGRAWKIRADSVIALGGEGGGLV